MKQKPQLIIVPDIDYEYGIKHGAYPEFEEELRTGEIVVASREEATIDYGIVTPKENEIYSYNIFDGTYRSITADNVEIEYIKAKAVALREALVLLGAYSAHIENIVVHTQEKDLRLSGKGKKGAVSLGADYQKQNQIEISLKSIIELIEYKRPRKSVNEIRDYVYTHGLGQESTLLAWIDRLERVGELEGPESIDVVFTQELKASRDLALNLKIVQSEIGFNIESIKKNTHTVTERIIIDFGGKQSN